MILENLFHILETMETEIGNKVSVSVRRYGEADLKFIIFWPDGFRMSHLFAIVESTSVSDEELFVSYLIKKAKELHPKLAPTIS